MAQVTRPAAEFAGQDRAQAVQALYAEHALGLMRLARVAVVAGRLARAKWLVPLAGAVGVVAVAAVAAAVVHANPDSQMADSATVPAIPPGGAGPPPFAVTVNGLGAAAVQQVATARTVATIQYAPGVTSYLAAAADAGRRTVVLAGQLRGGVAFYVIRLTADGKPNAPSPVPGGQDRLLSFPRFQPAAYNLKLAMTPDGSKFAYLLRSPQAASPVRMVLGAEDTATGVARKWLLMRGAGGGISSLSWAGDDRRLALTGQISLPGVAPAARPGVLVLDTAAAGAPDFGRDLRALVAAPGPGPPLAAAISPDGSTVYVEQPLGGRARALAAVSVATGAPVRVLLRWRDAVNAAAQVTLDGTGQQLLVAMGGSLRSVDVRSGAGRRLSFPASPRLYFDLAW
jgi:hypothetical protein